MKQTVFGTDRSACEKNLRRDFGLCALVLCGIVCVHILCTAARTADNHTVMLLANIAADIIGGSFLIARLSMCVFPRKKLLKLYDSATQEATGQVLALGNDLIHYMGVDCCEVSLPDRRLFLPAGTMALTVGEHYRFRLKGNLIVEVCDYGQE